jgi:hypothetical protein
MTPPLTAERIAWLREHLATGGMISKDEGTALLDAAENQETAHELHDLVMRATSRADAAEREAAKLREFVSQEAMPLCANEAEFPDAPWCRHMCVPCRARAALAGVAGKEAEDG